MASPSLAGNATSNALLGGINFGSGASGILEETGAVYVRVFYYRILIENLETNAQSVANNITRFEVFF